MVSPNRGNQELEMALDAPIVERQSLQLSDLNEDVLLKIFLYLNLEELIGVVEMDERFLHICRQAFQKIHNDKYVKLPRKANHITTENYFIKNVDLLHYFGRNISKMDIEFNDSNRDDHHIYYLIVLHCRHTLTELDVSGDFSKGLKTNKPFTKLKTLRIRFQSLDVGLCKIAEWFPVLENVIVTEGSENRDHHLHKLVLTVSKIHMGSDTMFKLPSIYLYLRRNLLRRDFVLSNLAVPSNCVKCLEVETVSLTDWYSRYIDKLSNLQTLKITSSFLPVNLIYPSILIKLDHLTHLEFNLEVVVNVNLWRIGTLVILPYMKLCKNLTTVKMTYKKEFDRPFAAVEIDAFLESMKNKESDYKLWSFSSQLSSHEITFKLEKYSSFCY